MDESQQLIQQHMNDLPQHIRTALEEFDWAQETLGIAHEYQLQIDQIDVFRNQTLLVILGIEPAKGYEKKLKSTMNISAELAEQLVQEANVRIFSELQKRAFHKEEVADLHADLQEEGIVLLDHDDAEYINTGDTKENNEVSETKKHQEPEKSHTKNSYLEPIDVNDLRGIRGHRINTQVLKTLTNYQQQQSEKMLNQEQSLEREKFEQTIIPEGDRLDLSPSKQEQALQSGSFLEQLK